MNKAILALLAALLAECTGGPRHRVPEMLRPGQFDQAPAEATA